jgi:hypothetical protein
VEYGFGFPRFFNYLRIIYSILFRIPFEYLFSEGALLSLQGRLAGCLLRITSEGLGYALIS